MSNPEHSTNYVYELSNKTGSLKYHQYQKGPLLGEGGFAACYKATRNTDKKSFAMKVIKLNDKKELTSSRDKHKTQKHPKLSTQEKANTEAQLLRICDHPNIVKYETDFIYENDFYLVMQYCQKGNFGEMLRRRGTISEVEARYYVKQMVEALQYLSQRRIIHREYVFINQSLKPANYLLTDTLKLKIADFGLATEVRNNGPLHRNICGTPNYISPEMIERKQYSYQVDLWSVGVILYSMLYGIPPFQTKNKDAKETYEKIKKCDFKLSDPKVSNEARDLISQILVLNPKKRISLQNIIAHPFMANYEIPQRLSVKYLKHEPDQKFLEFYQFQKQSKPQNKTQLSNKNSPFIHESALNNQLQNSFSLSSQCNLSQKISKKEKKRIKKQKKQSEFINLKKGSKGIPSTIKKHQKDEELTSSPQSEAESRNSYEKNKCIQYPSEQKQSNMQFVKIFMKKAMECEDLPKNVKKQQVVEPIQLVKFPSFTALMNQLSFDYMPNNQQNKQILNGTVYSNITKKNLRKGKKVIVESKRVKSTRNQVLEENQNINLKNQNQSILKKLHQQQTSEKIYLIEDFLAYSSSIYESSQKLIKLIYCLKQQNTSKQQDYKVEQNLQNQKFIKFIGVIFKDNSSIIIRIQHNKKQFTNNSIYLHNVQICQNKNQKSNFSKPFLCQQYKHEQIVNTKFSNNVALSLHVDMMNKNSLNNHKKNIHLKDKEKIFKDDFTGLPFEIKLKIRYAKDTVKYFQHLLIHNNQNIEKMNVKLENKIKIQTLENFHDHKQTNSVSLSDENFIFINFFKSKNSGKNLYFELNDGSKHQMYKNMKQQKYQKLFKNTNRVIPKCELYNLVVYFPNRLTGYIKTSQNKLRRLTKEQLNTNQLSQRSIDKDTQVKIQKDSSDQEQQWLKTFKKQKIFLKQKMQLEKVKFQKNIQDFLIQQENKQNQLSKLLHQLCHSFRQKTQLIYLRNRDIISSTLHQKQKLQDENKICQYSQNYCEIEIQNGRLDLKLRIFENNLLVEPKDQFEE